MVTVFDTAATVRSLEATGLERQQAEAIATACREAADVVEPVTQSDASANAAMHRVFIAPNSRTVPHGDRVPRGSAKTG